MARHKARVAPLAFGDVFYERTPLARAKMPFSLPDELLRKILDHFVADPDKMISLDRRPYLSQESFATSESFMEDQMSDMSNFRLVCRQFNRNGVIHQFARLSTRFSLASFERLERIANHGQLAEHVRKLTYILPMFYSDGELVCPFA